MLSKSVSLSLALLWISVLTGCLGDMNQNDYRAHQFAEYEAKLQQIKGSYIGTVTSIHDQGSLGVMTVVLHPDSHLQKSSDNLTSEQSAVVAGTLSFSGAVSANIAFSEAYYNDSSGIFQATVPVQTASGSQEQLVLQGKISGSQFAGEIEADGYPQYGGEFTLIKDGPTPSPAALTSGKALELTPANERFVSSYTYQGQQKKLVMSLLYKNTAPEQYVLDIFRPSADLQVVCDFGDFPAILFQNAHLDESVTPNTLKGQAQTTTGYTANLDCDRTPDRQGWNCSLTTGTKDFDAVLFPEAPAQSPKK